MSSRGGFTAQAEWGRSRLGVRDLPLPPDRALPARGFAHIDPDLGAAALQMMEQNMRTELIPARHCLD